MKVFFFSLLPAFAGGIWLTAVLVLTFLAATVFTGGHPPFAIIPLAANIFGAVVVYPLCIILSAIGANLFDAEKMSSFPFSPRFIAAAMLVLFFLDATVFYNEIPAIIIILTFLYPLFFFENHNQSRTVKVVAWVIFVFLLMLAFDITNPYVGRQALSIVAILVNFAWMLNRSIEIREIGFNPGKLSRITLMVLALVEFLAIPFALMLR